MSLKIVTLSVYLIRTPLTIPSACCTIVRVMKSSIHPQNYRPVVFSDEQAGFAFLTQSTAQTTDTITWEDGNEYPLVKVHISSASHPFFPGEKRVIDIEGRVDKFKNRAAAAQKALDARKKAAAKVRVRKTDEDDTDEQ